MFIEVRKDRHTPSVKKESKMESSVPPYVTALTCATTLGLAVMFSLKLNPTDMGAVYAADQIPALMQQEVKRIQEDKLMPPQAKAIALQMLAAHGVKIPRR